MATILEEAETESGDRISTVETAGGDELLMNLDVAVCGLAELFSSLDRELREGWTLSDAWYYEQIRALKQKCVLVHHTS